jgi:energy-coupling factor transporter transmembrane protein EcfT
MESRAWGAIKKRTNLYVLKMKRGDYFLIAISTAILAIAIYVWLYIPIPYLTQVFMSSQ